MRAETKANYSLSELIKEENFKVITNVNERTGRGDKPAVIVSEADYFIKELCPTVITAPVGVEAVWVLLQNKNNSPRSQIYNIVVCSYYYAGPKSTPKDLIFDHFVENIALLSAKYGPKSD